MHNSGLTEADIESSWTHQDNTTTLVNIDDFVGIGTSEPYKKTTYFFRQLQTEL